MAPRKIKVLLAYYKGEEWIVEQVLSIKNQSHIEAFISISVDPSDDDLGGFYADLPDDNVNILPIHEKFGSAAPNFFRLIRDVDLSEFEFVAFSDQDDIWNEDKLFRAVKIMNKSNCEGYSSNVTAFWPDGRSLLIDKAQPQVEWDYLFESAGPGCTFVMTNKLALELQVFVCQNKDAMKSVWLHDWFTYAFARSQGHKWYIDKKATMQYRQHENNQVGVNTGFKAFLHRVRFVLSGRALKQSAILATLFELEDQAFVKQWHNLTRPGLLFLSFNAYRCRRKRSDKILFAFSCLILTLIGNSK